MRGIDVKVQVVVGLSSQPGSDRRDCGKTISTVRQVHMHGALNITKKMFYSTRHIEYSDTYIEY